MVPSLGMTIFRSARRRPVLRCVSRAPGKPNYFSKTFGRWISQENIGHRPHSFSNPVRPTYTSATIPVRPTDTSKKNPVRLPGTCACFSVRLAGTSKKQVSSIDSKQNLRGDSVEHNFEMCQVGALKTIETWGSMPGVFQEKTVTPKASKKGYIKAGLLVQHFGASCWHI